MPRVFIPARLDDNPHLMRDASYERTLREQENPILVDALRWGKWDVMVGQAFPEWNEATHTYDPRDHYFDLDPTWPRWACCDWGQRKPYCIGYFCGMPNGRVVMYRETYGCEEAGTNIGTNEPPNEVAQREWQNRAGDNVYAMVCDTGMNSPSTNGYAGESQRQMFERAGWTVINAVKDRIAGKRAVHRWLGTMMPDGMPMFMVSQACENLIRTIPTLIYNTRNISKIEDVDDQGEDHPYDMLRYSAMSPFASNVASMADVQMQHGARSRAMSFNAGLSYDPNDLDAMFGRADDSAAYDPNDVSWSRNL